MGSVAVPVYHVCMNQINSLPVPNRYGLDFDYSVWSAGTQLELVNVPWSSDYRDIVRFQPGELDRYIDTLHGERIEIHNLTYAPQGHPIRVDKPFNVVNRFNYIRVTNPAQPVSGDFRRSFYYFIQGLDYVAPNTTELYVQLDVWATYQNDVKFGNCYIERGHIGIANEHQFDDYGRENLTIPEGLDIGNEYVIQSVDKHTIIASQLPVDNAAQKTGAVLVASTTDLFADAGSVDNPSLKVATGSTFEKLPNGCSFYYFAEWHHFSNFTLTMKDKPWVMSGIISVSAVPKMQFDDISMEWHSFSGGRAGRIKDEAKQHPETWEALPGFRDGVNLGRYHNLKKFLTYPYLIIQVTTNSGNPIILKPECVSSNGVRLTKLLHAALPSPRLAVYPENYNSRGSTAHDWEGEFLDIQTGITDWPTFSVTNDNYLMYMASNRNSINYAYSSADWSQQKALAGNQNSFNQATASNNTANAQNANERQNATNQTDISNRAAWEHQIVNGVHNIAGGAITGAVGGPAGVAAGAGMAAFNTAFDVANTMVSTNAASQSTAAANATSAANNMLRSSNAIYNRDTNKAYADFAANGDYANAIAGVNAKVQDAKMLQPSTSGQIGGDAFNLATTDWSVYTKIKFVQPAVMRAIGDFWLRYGYAIQRFANIPESLQVMEKFTYWKLRETYIVSQSCPESFRQAIRGIFEKGVTVWSKPEYIGMIDIADNEPIRGISL